MILILRLFNIVLPPMVFEMSGHYFEQTYVAFYITFFELLSLISN